MSCTLRKMNENAHSFCEIYFIYEHKKQLCIGVQFIVFSRLCRRLLDIFDRRINICMTERIFAWRKYCIFFLIVVVRLLYYIKLVISIDLVSGGSEDLPGNKGCRGSGLKLIWVAFFYVIISTSFSSICMFWFTSQLTVTNMNPAQSFHEFDSLILRIKKYQSPSSSSSTLENVLSSSSIALAATRELVILEKFMRANWEFPQIKHFRLHCKQRHF